MKTEKVLQKLEGIQTVDTVMKALDVNRQMAIYYVHRLRKKGYVKYFGGKRGPRIYDIRRRHRLGGTSYTELLNKDAPIKLAEAEIHRIYGKIPSHEELLIHAIKKRNVRHLVSGIAQFKKITDWSRLYHLAKKEDLLREVGALYDLARKVIKTRRMPERFRNNAMPKKYAKKRYILKGLRTDDFKEIEDRWKVYLPINIKDLEEYTYDKHGRPKGPVISNLKRAG